MTDTQYSGDVEVRYFLGADQIAVQFRPSAPLSGDVVTLDGQEYLVDVRAVRFSEATDKFEAFEVQVRAAALDG